MTQVIINLNNKRDLPFLMKLSRRMGWTMSSETKSGIDLGLEDIEAGRVFNASSAEDMIAQILK